MNEIFIERKDLYAVKLDVFVNDKHLVLINGDGVIIST